MAYGKDTNFMGENLGPKKQTTVSLLGDIGRSV